MKALLWIVGIVVLLVVGAGAFLVLNSGDLIKTAIEDVGPDHLGADISVGEVNLSLTEGSGAVKQLQLGNPQGFSGSHAMKLNEIRVVLDPENISEQLVVLKEISIDGADLLAIAQGKNTNFQKLMDNITEATGGPSETEDSAATEEAGAKFIVERFAFTNAKVALDSDVLGKMDLSIPDIRLADVGRKTNGATAAELARELLKPISSAISGAVVSQGLDLDGVKGQVEEKLKEKLGEKLGGGLKGLLDK
ncbi:MAG: hypothetical protein AAF541_04195 [Pseudomonadota bacterium]